MAEFRRKPNRLGPKSYRGRRSYFLTLCARNRKNVFADGALVGALLTVLKENCFSQQCAVYAYCFMPDHLHLILIGESDSSDLERLMRAFKGAATAAARRFGVSALWQKGYYDHILRDGKSTDEAAWYLFLNPVRTGLARKAEEWAHLGSFAFEWKSLAPPTERFRPPWKAGVVT